MVFDNDRTILRTLAKQYKELCDSETNQNNIANWRNLNSMVKIRPMVYCNCELLLGEIDPHLPQSQVESEELRDVELWFRRNLWEQSIGDDRVFYLWYTVKAEMFKHPEGDWGVAPNIVHDDSSRGWRHLPILKTMEDLAKLKATEHKVIDPNPPIAQKLQDVFGDIIQNSLSF